jgi:hypothetical protein
VGDEGGGDRRARLLIAGGAAVALVALVAAIILLSGRDEQAAQAAVFPAPEECLDAWNDDPNAREFARHNATFHGYEGAQVGYMRPQPDGHVSAEPADGACVVVFPRSELDPEAFAAGQVLAADRWATLDTLLPPEAVARLQSEAIGGANARPAPGGQLLPATDD